MPEESTGRRVAHLVKDNRGITIPQIAEKIGVKVAKMAAVGAPTSPRCAAG